VTDTAIQRRLRQLEASDGGDDGCPRCRGVMIILGSVETGEDVRASWNGKPISAEELEERQSETSCPRCGRDLTGDHRSEIRIGRRLGSRS